MNPRTVIKSITWTTRSDRDAAVIYTISGAGHDAPLSCSCPARKAACKHVVRALAGELGKPVVRCTQRPDRRQVLTESARERASALEV